MAGRKEAIAALEGLGIHFRIYEHPAVFTVEDAWLRASRVPGAQTKNLFLRNRKKSAFYLVIADAAFSVDLKRLAKDLHEDRLSFASPETLRELLGAEPGSVSPFCLLADTNHLVRAVADERLLEYHEVGFHPNDNTATLVIPPDGLQRLTAFTGHELMFLPMPYGAE